MAAVAGSLATLLLLGTAWLFAPTGLVAALFVLRTGLEDGFLRRGLPGYAEYAARMRFRLGLHVW